MDATDGHVLRSNSDHIGPPLRSDWGLSGIRLKLRLSLDSPRDFATEPSSCVLNMETTLQSENFLSIG